MQFGPKGTVLLWLAGEEANVDIVAQFQLVREASAPRLKYNPRNSFQGLAQVVGSAQAGSAGGRQLPAGLS